jgi:hypothetical protein
MLPKLIQLSVQARGPFSARMLSMHCRLITRLSLRDVEVTPETIRELAGLKRLTALSITVGPVAAIIHETVGFAEAFVELGQVEDASRFRRLTLRNASFDLTAFFETRRCQGLQQIKLDGCLFAPYSMRNLAASTRDTLQAVHLRGCSDAFLPSLLMSCPRIERVKICVHTDDILQQVGAVRANVRVFEIAKSPSFRLRNQAIRALAPAMEHTVEFTLECARHDTTSEAIMALVNSCPHLVKLCLHKTTQEVGNALRTLLSKEIAFSFDV